MSRKTTLTLINAAIQRAKKLARKHQDAMFIVYREDKDDYVVISYHSYLTEPGYSPDNFVRSVRFDHDTQTFDITDR
jgi:hypothetical protein